LLNDNWRFDKNNFLRRDFCLADRRRGCIRGGLFARSGASFEGAGGVSSEARMREIGGKTARFGFASPSSAFLVGFFRSMSETLSASRLEGRAGGASGFEAGALRGFAAGATSSFSFCFESFALAAVAVGLRAAGVPRAAVLRVAVLLLVFVAIVVRLKFCSWLERP
jgi:hypothetical protein